MASSVMRVLGLVPARAGSKGIPDKNLRSLGGRPLLAHTAEAALAATRLDRVVLSTEDEAIAEVGASLGLAVAFMRPAKLADDDTTMLAVMQHALASLPEHYDTLCLLQPTSPFRPSGLIDRCIERFALGGVDSVVTMLPVPAAHNPHWVYVPAPDGGVRLSTGEVAPIARRQDLPPAYHRDGSVYVLGADRVTEGQPYGTSVEAVVLEPAETVNIDDLDDWARAEALVERRR